MRTLLNHITIAIFSTDCFSFTLDMQVEKRLILKPLEVFTAFLPYFDEKQWRLIAFLAPYMIE